MPTNDNSSRNSTDAKSMMDNGGQSVPPLPEDYASNTPDDANNFASDSSQNHDNQRTLSRVVERINSSQNILIALSKNPTVDELSAAIALAIILNDIGKHTTAIYSGLTPNAIEFLKPETTFEKDTNSLQDFIIALNKEKADHLRYKVDGDFVKVYITPYRTEITEKDLEFSHGDYNVDLVIALNVQSGEDLDAALFEYRRILHDASAINITTGEAGRFAEIEWNDQETSSVSEMTFHLVESLGNDLIGQEVATALLTGIISATERFSNGRTRPDTMTVASRLMAAGANQQLIVSNVEKGGNTTESEIGTGPSLSAQNVSLTDSTPELSPETQVNVREHAFNSSPIPEPTITPGPIAAPNPEPSTTPQPVPDPTLTPTPDSEPAPTPEPVTPTFASNPAQVAAPAISDNPIASEIAPVPDLQFNTVPAPDVIPETPSMNANVALQSASISPNSAPQVTSMNVDSATQEMPMNTNTAFTGGLDSTNVAPEQETKKTDTSKDYSKMMADELAQPLPADIEYNKDRPIKPVVESPETSLAPTQAPEMAPVAPVPTFVDAQLPPPPTPPVDLSTPNLPLPPAISSDNQSESAPVGVPEASSGALAGASPLDSVSDVTANSPEPTPVATSNDPGAFQIPNLPPAT